MLPPLIITPHGDSKRQNFLGWDNLALGELQELQKGAPEQMGPGCCQRDSGPTGTRAELKSPWNAP